MDAKRNGNFTSSEIVALTGIAKRPMTDMELAQRPKKGVGSKTTTIDDINILSDAAFTYIEEKNMERRLGRSLSDESNARALTWGKHLEPFVFELLSLDYTYNSQETLTHPTINFWTGTPDGFNLKGNNRKVIDIKCPQTLKSFCQLVQPLYDAIEMTEDERGIWVINKIRETHKDGEKYYWQLVSNAIISGCDEAELIVFAPYRSQLDEIRQRAEGNKDYYWIWGAEDNQLPYLNDGGYYKNINIISFPIPQEDKDFLTKKVELAGEYLLKQPHCILTHYDNEHKTTIVE